jgi:mRNA interferase MazF
MVKSGARVLRGEVYWVNLDPTVGAEIKKTRPCLVVSPDDMNAVLPRVIVAPITSKGQALGCRPEVIIGGKSGRLLLDQIRCIDKSRLAGKLGAVDAALWHDVLLKMLS